MVSIEKWRDRESFYMLSAMDCLAKWNKTIQHVRQIQRRRRTMEGFCNIQGRMSMAGAPALLKHLHLRCISPVLTGGVIGTCFQIRRPYSFKTACISSVLTGGGGSGGVGGDGGGGGGGGGGGSARGVNPVLKEPESGAHVIILDVRVKSLFESAKDYFSTAASCHKLEMI